MRILQVNAIYGAKSTGVIVKDIHVLLKQKGYESYVLAPNVKQQEDNVICIKNKVSEKMHALLTRLWGLQGLGSKIATKKYLKKVDTIKPDVIHIHNVHSNYFNYKEFLKYTSKRGIPVIMTLHDSWLFTGKCYHFLDVGCERWLTECYDCPKRFQEIPSLLADNSTKVFKLRKSLYDSNDIKVVGCSKWISDCASKSPLFKNAENYYIYNGIDINVFSESGENLKKDLGFNDKFVILVMANKWFDEKNEKLRDKFLQSLSENDKIVIVGCKKEQHVVHDRVKCLSYTTNRDELAKIYRTADVFLNLTYVDTLPTVNIEATACGTPVITFDSGGSGELIDEGVTGYVIEPGSLEQILDSIKKIKDGAISRRKCREWAVCNFDKNVNYEKYIDLYRRICTEK